MVSLFSWARYLTQKFQYSFSVCLKSYKSGQITNKQVIDIGWQNLFQGRLTFLQKNKGEEMAPMIGSQGGTLLIRKLPTATPTHVFVGDVVILKDPEKSSDYLIRRLAAIEGYEMISNDINDEPFVLEKDQCWVLADNDELKPQEANDSRVLGPVSMADIVGRAIYCLRTGIDHGPVVNSYLGMKRDSPVLDVELDVDEMVKSHNA